MKNVCPQGHDSTETDFCSNCGTEMSPSADAVSTPQAVTASAAPPANLGKCPTCTSPRENLQTRYCGICGHDYQTGQAGVVPDDLKAAAPAASSTTNGVSHTAGSASGNPRIELSVGVDVRKPGAPQGLPERRFTVEDGEFKLGRAAAGEKYEGGVGITGDNAISKKHALVVRQGDGSYVLRDLNSTNGTKMGGKELTANVDYPLAEGATFEIGEWTVVKVVAIKTV